MHDHINHHGRAEHHGQHRCCDVVGTSGLQLNRATAEKIGRRGRNTDDGLLPSDVIYAVVLASDYAFPFLLIQTITEDRLLT